MNKNKVKNQGKNILYTILLWFFIASCHYTTETRVKSQEEKNEICKFNATRIVNKVLGSTNIAYLYGFDDDGRFAIYRNDFIIKYYWCPLKMNN